MKKIGIPLLFWLFAPWAHCLCNVPQPRTVCAEYSQTDATVVAKLTHIDSVPPGAPDYFTYSFVLVRQIHGQVPRTFDIYEGNDSGRATFDWKLNGEYLLFLQKGNPATHNDWFIDGCGNSGPLANADFALNEITHIPELRGNGMIAGVVKNSAEAIGIRGVTINISGSHYSAKLKTDNKGGFRREIPAGTYKITATQNGASIAGDLFSYEDPSHVIIHADGCAQVQFTEQQN